MNKNEGNTRSEKIYEILSFNLCGRDFAVDVDYVEMVIEKPNITFVPKAREFIKGVINLRGRIVTVVDLTKLLGIEMEKENNNFKNVMILRVGDMEVGFLVDNVKEVIRAKESDIDTQFGSVEYERKAKGVIKKEDKLVVYLDVEEILKT